MTVNQNPTGNKAILYCEELKLYVLADGNVPAQAGTSLPQAGQASQGVLEILG